MDVIVKGRHTSVRERFRRHAEAKVAKLEKLDSKALRVDVEVSAERNRRLAGRGERVELTVVSRGPAIRAEAAAGDRYGALDIALAKLEARLRRACGRRKARHGGHPSSRLIEPGEVPAQLAAPDGAGAQPVGGSAQPAGGSAQAAGGSATTAAQEPGPDYAADEPEHLIPIEMQGDGPLVVREKFHRAAPMTVDQALFEMELVGHDFFLFRDRADGLPSVVYRRKGYKYGLIRLVERQAPDRILAR